MSSKRSPGRKPVAGSNKYLPFVIIGVVLIAVIGVAAYVLKRPSRQASTLSSGAASSNTQANSNYNPRPTVQSNPTPGASPAWEKGGAAAPVVLEEFGDYQCPPCAMIHPVLEQIGKDYGDRVKLVFRHFPLQQMHKNAFAAARAAEAAGMQGRFWEMHDMIYDNQKAWADSPEPRTVFADYARRLSLNVEKFQQDTDGKQVADRVLADYNRGISLGVKGTPTIFLNGSELPANRTLHEPSLRAAIDQVLGLQNTTK